MFADAYEIAIKFTSPVIISMRYYDKTVTCHIGSSVLLNDEGWVITAAHLLKPYFEFLEHQKEITKFENNVAQIENNKKLNRKQKRKKISKLDKNQKWITNNSYWWGSEKYQIPEFAILQEGDIAIGRIEGYKHEDDIKYPIFMDPTKMRFGTSLCKLGYPYHQVKASYDDANKKFKLAPGTLPNLLTRITWAKWWTNIRSTRKYLGYSKWNFTFPIRFQSKSFTRRNRN
jgi:hypothetical protein